MLGTIYSILKFLRFDIAYRNIEALLPQNIRTWINTTGKNYRIPILSVGQLHPKFINACRLITDRVGAENIGDYLEFGVCGGASLTCMFHALADLKLNHVRIFGFDSFEGLPAIAAIDIENDLQPGECANSITATSEQLTKNGIDWNRTFLIEGWFSERLNENLIQDYNIQKASLIMIHCDLYSSAKESLNFCRPLIKDVSIIFFGDWSEGKNIGEKRAFEEFLQENPQLKSELVAQYKNNGVPKGRIFLVKNTG